VYAEYFMDLLTNASQKDLSVSRDIEVRSYKIIFKYLLPFARIHAGIVWMAVVALVLQPRVGLVDPIIVRSLYVML
jgi:hypothetical protein